MDSPQKQRQVNHSIFWWNAAQQAWVSNGGTILVRPPNTTPDTDWIIVDTRLKQEIPFAENEEEQAFMLAAYLAEHES